VLKIMAGRVKGRRLQTLSNSPNLRPILARVKKSLFDILRPRLFSTQFLDLYAGSGAVGMEALSQGASFATFVEIDERCLKLIRENLEVLRLEGNAAVYRRNVLGDLSLLPKPFDLIFMGPPYKDDAKQPVALVKPSLENIARYDLLGDKGLVIAQHHKKEDVQVNNAKGIEWILKRQERYGDTMLSFFERLS
jgi:16S rRNA (guanine(966)-N(2))-methyltransferase RsmD